MAKIKKKKKTELEQLTEYIAFLENRVASENYKAAVTQEEFDKTKEKLKNARFRLKVMQPKK